MDRDPKEAVKWFTAAAKQGYTQAQNNLGLCYLEGNGVDQNPGEAVKWLTTAAKLGNSLAQHNLATC